MRVQFIRELIQDGKIAIHFVPTKYNVADLLTKPLAKKEFQFLRNILMKGHGGVEPSWTQANEHVHVVLTTHSIVSRGDWSQGSAVWTSSVEPGPSFPLGGFLPNQVCVMYCAVLILSSISCMYEISDV
jgi:hypothetical protein